MRLRFGRLVIGAAAAWAVVSLTSGLAATGGDAPRPISEFRPSKHGFRFVNHFPGSPIAIGGVEIGGGAGTAYGLCGGMAAAAADYFLARTSVPTRTDPPRRPDPLFAYLSQRQRDSLGPGMAQGVRFSRWMSTPDDGPDGTKHRSAAELGGVIASIEAGEPVAVGMVLVSRLAPISGPERRAGASRRGAIWENHQVLAYGVRWRSTSSVDVLIYDPNHPGDDAACLRVDAVVVGEEASPLGFVAPVLGARVRLVVSAKKTAAPVRGIFSMPYAPARPPEVRGD